MLYSTIQGDSNEPDRRWVNLMKQQIQSAEVELVAELAHAPATVEQLLALKPGDFIELDLDPAIQAKVDGVPVFDCHYGTSNGKYALKVDQLLAGSREELARRKQCQLTTPHGRDAADAAAAEWAAGAPRPRPRCTRPPTRSRRRRSRTSRRPPARRRGNDINMILDIPVQLTVELGRTRIPIKHILQLAQGSVVELDALAGEPMDVLVNGYLIAQGEVVVVNDKFGIRLTDIVTPSERMRRLSRG